MIEIRSAKPDDASAISEIQRSSWFDTYEGLIDQTFLNEFKEKDTSKQWERTLSNKANSTVLLSYKGKPVGFASWGIMREQDIPFKMELYAIYILKEYRGLGIGAAALAYIKRYISNEPLFVWVLDGNPSVVFYKKNGEPLGYRKHVTIGGKSYAEISFSL